MTAASRIAAYAMSPARVGPETRGGTTMVVSVKTGREGSTPLARLGAWVVFALMAAATAYTVWIALANFKRIGV
jgi:hypothetical protein